MCPPESLPESLPEHRPVSVPAHSLEAGRHAIVIGGSIAGCLVAEILSRRFERVSLIEKADFDDEAAERRNLPQENHVHLLLLRGKQIMEQVFPGLLHELEQAGAQVVDLGHGVKWYQYGKWKQRFPTGISAHYCSRRLIDNLVRRRIRQNPKIEVLANSAVSSLSFAAPNPATAGAAVAVNGVQLDRAGGLLLADLVIDASGRGSRTAQWLANAGLGQVEETRVLTRLGYASRIYRRRPEYAGQWDVLLALPKAPQQRRMGVISPIEGDRWLVTTGGWFGDFPKPEPEQFLAFLQQLPVPDIHDVIKDAEPLSGVFGHAVPGSLWRHYETLPTLPPGLLVIGDALCSMNPLYSQGMTLCALEADVLERCLPDLLGARSTTRAVQAELAQVVAGAWEMARTEDMRFPETDGVRNLALRWQHWFGAQLVQLSASDRLTLQTQIGVTNLVMPGRQLYRPRIAAKMALGVLQRPFAGLRKWITQGGAT